MLSIFGVADDICAADSVTVLANGVKDGLCTSFLGEITSAGRMTPRHGAQLCCSIMMPDCFSNNDGSTQTEAEHPELELEPKLADQLYDGGRDLNWQLGLPSVSTIEGPAFGILRLYGLKLYGHSLQVFMQCRNFTLEVESSIITSFSVFQACLG